MRGAEEERKRIRSRGRKQVSLPLEQESRRSSPISLGELGNRGARKIRSRVAAREPVGPSGFQAAAAWSDSFVLLGMLVSFRRECFGGFRLQGEGPSSDGKIVARSGERKNDHEDADPPHPADSFRDHPHILSYTRGQIPAGRRPADIHRQGSFPNPGCPANFFQRSGAAQRRPSNLRPSSPPSP